MGGRSKASTLGVIVPMTMRKAISVPVFARRTEPINRFSIDSASVGTGCDRLGLKLGLTRAVFGWILQAKRRRISKFPLCPETKGTNWMAIERSWQPRSTQSQDKLFVLQVFSNMRFLVGVADLSDMLSLLC
jgi:hypothetical protein